MESTSRTCLITGGAQGIGWAIARLLADQGMEVYVCDVCPEYLAAAESAAQEARWGKRVHLTQCDVADRAAVDAWVADTYGQSGRLDVLVNNAAVVHWGDVAGMPVGDIQRTIRVGFEGMVFGIQAVLPRMLQVGQGHIVNMGSIAGDMFLFGGCAAYSATKAAIAAYTRILRLELRKTGIHVTLIRPGLVAGTSLLGRSVDSRQLPRIADLLPVATPDQVVRGVLRALHRAPAVVTIPWQYQILGRLYSIFPQLSRWLCRLGGASRRRYAITFQD